MRSRSWSYGNWIYNYLFNQCLSPLMLWVGILLITRCTRYKSTLCDKVCQWLAVGRSVVFSGYFFFLHQFNWPSWHNWNIVEGGIKYHTPPPNSFHHEHTWWMLFQKHVVHTEYILVDVYISIIITSAGRVLISDCIICPVVSASTLPWFI